MLISLTLSHPERSEVKSKDLNKPGNETCFYVLSLTSGDPSALLAWPGCQVFMLFSHYFKKNQKFFLKGLDKHPPPHYNEDKVEVEMTKEQLQLIVD